MLCYGDVWSIDGVAGPRPVYSLFYSLALLKTEHTHI